MIPHRTKIYQWSFPARHTYLKEVVGGVYKARWLVAQARKVAEAARSAPKVGRLSHRHQNNLAQARWWQQGNSFPSFINVNILPLPYHIATYIFASSSPLAKLLVYFVYFGVQIRR